MNERAERPLPEGLENVTPENIEIVLRAMAQIFANFSPALLVMILGQQAYDAIKYLVEKPPPERSVKSRIEDILPEVNQPTQWIDIERGKAQPPGAYDAGAKRLATLLDKRMVESLKTIREYWPNLGDVKRLEAYAESEHADEESKNAIAILSLLGEHINEWCPVCVHKRTSSSMSSDTEDAPMPGNLEEKRKRRSK